MFKDVGMYHDKVRNIDNRELGIFIEVDYDDVNHYEIDEFIPIIVDALNQVDSLRWASARDDAAEKRLENEEDW